VSSITGDAQRWLSFVDSLPWERGCLDQSSYHSFLRAASLGVKPQEALHSVAVRIKEAGDNPKPSKLSRQLRRAYGFATGKERPAGYCQIPKAERPKFLPDYARKFAERVPDHIDQAWLRKRSPVKVPWILTPAEFLFTVYEAGDKVLIFSDYESQGQELWQKYSLRLLDRDELASFARGRPDGAWFLANPVDGKEHLNEDQRMSRRSKESVKSFRFAVLESDCQPLEQWLRILVQLPLPIVSITSSGGKSLHALVMVDANSKTNWDETVGAIKPKLIYLGADPRALTAVRLTRLPNCYRGERLQELIYLNPNPSREPIFRRS
jgi:hypothetical protein